MSEFLYVRESRLPMAEVERRLEQAVKNRQFGVVGVIDLRGKMKEKGVDFQPPCKIYEICNPHRAKEVLERELAISTVLPCRISVYEEDGVTRVATLLPTETLKLFGADDLASVAREVETAIKGMMDEAVGE